MSSRSSVDPPTVTGFDPFGYCLGFWKRTWWGPSMIIDRDIMLRGRLSGVDDCRGRLPRAVEGYHIEMEGELVESVLKILLKSIIDVVTTLHDDAESLETLMASERRKVRLMIGSERWLRERQR